MWLRVIVFYVLTLFFTVLLGGLQETGGILQDTAILPQWGPGITALLMLMIFRRDGHRLSVVDRRIPAARYALAALIPAGGALVVYLVNRVALGGIEPADWTGVPWGLVLWFPFGAVGEELGWRGYLQKRLDRQMTGLTSSMVVGVLWALWHVGMYQNGALYMVLFVLVMISYTVVLYALVHDVGFNLLVAALFHLVINLTNLFSFDVISEVTFMAVNAVVWAAIAAAVYATRRPSFTAMGTNSGPDSVS